MDIWKDGSSCVKQSNQHGRGQGDGRSILKLRWCFDCVEKARSGEVQNPDKWRELIRSSKCVIGNIDKTVKKEGKGLVFSVATQKKNTATCSIQQPAEKEFVNVIEEIMKISNESKRQEVKKRSDDGEERCSG